MWNEEPEDDGLGAIRGLMNVFVIMLLAFMIIGTIWGILNG